MRCTFITLHTRKVNIRARAFLLNALVEHNCIELAAF